MLSRGRSPRVLIRAGGRDPGRGLAGGPAHSAIKTAPRPSAGSAYPRPPRPWPRWDSVCGRPGFSFRGRAGPQKPSWDGHVSHRAFRGTPVPVGHFWASAFGGVRLVLPSGVGVHVEVALTLLDHRTLPLFTWEIRSRILYAFRVHKERYFKTSLTLHFWTLKPRCPACLRSRRPPGWGRGGGWPPGQPSSVSGVSRPLVHSLSLSTAEGLVLTLRPGDQTPFLVWEALRVERARLGSR